MFKKIAFLSLILINTCSAFQLKNYQETVEAINHGKSVEFILDWDQCKLNVPNLKTGVTTTVSPDHINVFKNGSLEFWDNRYIHSLKIMPQLGPTYHAHTFTFSENNELHVVDNLLDPVTYKEKAPAIEATCQIGVGFKVFVK